jgi:trans-aconitate methyltransferase
MEEEGQARAYAEADFEQPHAMFVRLFAEFVAADPPFGRLVDLGCGPADITVRLARRFPAAAIDGIDGSAAMLRHGAERLARERLESRIRLIHGRLPGHALPRRGYDAVASNSLLHHLGSPDVLWQAIAHCARPGAPVFVMDLLRPETEPEALRLLDEHASGAPEVLRHDFFHSLLAAYRPDEVRAQLDAAGLADFRVDVVSDRHLTVRGRMPRA